MIAPPAKRWPQAVRDAISMEHQGSPGRIAAELMQHGASYQQTTTWLDQWSWSWLADELATRREAAGLPPAKPELVKTCSGAPLADGEGVPA